jgi:sec-independent protein translocase protein TatA
MFGLGVPEVALILVIGLVVFGPGKLPEVGKAVGKSLREFKAASEDEVKPAATEVLPVNKEENAAVNPQMKAVAAPVKVDSAVITEVKAVPVVNKEDNAVKTDVK